MLRKILMISALLCAFALLVPNVNVSAYSTAVQGFSDRPAVMTSWGCSSMIVERYSGNPALVCYDFDEQNVSDVRFALGGTVNVNEDDYLIFFMDMSHFNPAMEAMMNVVLFDENGVEYDFHRIEGELDAQFENENGKFFDYGRKHSFLFEPGGAPNSGYKGNVRIKLSSFEALITGDAPRSISQVQIDFFGDCGGDNGAFVVYDDFHITNEADFKVDDRCDYIYCPPVETVTEQPAPPPTEPKTKALGKTKKPTTAKTETETQFEASSAVSVTVSSTSEEPKTVVVITSDEEEWEEKLRAALPMLVAVGLMAALVKTLRPPKSKE